MANLTPLLLVPLLLAPAAVLTTSNEESHECRIIALVGSPIGTGATQGQCRAPPNDPPERKMLPVGTVLRVSWDGAPELAAYEDRSTRLLAQGPSDLVIIFDKEMGVRVSAPEGAVVVDQVVRLTWKT